MVFNINVTSYVTGVTLSGEIIKITPLLVALMYFFFVVVLSAFVVLNYCLLFTDKGCQFGLDHHSFLGTN